MSAQMTDNARGKFRVGNWIADPAAGVITGNCIDSDQADAESIVLRPREMDLLVYLAQRAGEVISAEELLEGVWSGVVVGTDSVYFSVSQLRKALGDDSHAPMYLETIPKRGYRLIAQVNAIDHPSPEAARAAGSFEFTSADSRMKLGIRSAVAITLIVGTWLGWQAFMPDDTTPQNQTIAVMPFVDLSPNQDQGYFSEGIAEELLNQLSRVPGLTVASRTSSFAFREGEPSIQEIGESLGVANVLEGSVRRDAERVRIAAQLVDASTGFQLWSESYDLPLANILTIQDQISRSLAAALELQLLESSTPPKERQPVNPRAYDHYLLGLRGLQINSYDALRGAASQFERVIAIDAEFADAYAALAFALQTMYLTGADTNPDTPARAEQLAKQALELDITVARAYVVLGNIATWSRHMKPAIHHYRSAVQHAPGNSDVLVGLAKALSHGGRADEAATLLQQALRNDPLNARVQSAYGMYLEKTGRTTESLAAYRRASKLNSQDPNTFWMVGRMQNELGDAAGAIESFETAAAIDPEDYEIASFVSLAYANVNLPEQASSWAQRALLLEPDSPITHAALAVSYYLQRRYDAALDVAQRQLADSSQRFSHDSREILSMVAVDELMRRDNLHEAEQLLLSSTALSDYLDAPAATTFTEFRQAQVHASELIALATIYQRQQRGADFDRTLSHLVATRLAATAAFREHNRAQDFLIEAQIEALNGETQTALAHLTEATELGYRAGWRLGIARTLAFNTLQANPRFTAIVADLEHKKSLEQARVQAERLAATAIGS